MRHGKYFVVLLSLFSFALLSTLQAEESDGMYEHDHKSSLKRSKSGLELRANLVASSGRFIQDFTETDPSGNTVQTDSSTSDLTSKGFSLIAGYGRDYGRRDQSSFFYIGYEHQKWNDEYDSVYHAFLFGAEGGLGSRSVKFIYGGEFSFGSLDTGIAGIDGLGYLYTFSAEPYIGLRLLATNGLSFNFRVGARGVFIEEVITPNDVNTVTTENGAFTANAQVGIGYSFY